MTQAQQAKVLRALAKRVAVEPLPVAMQEALARELEDRIDREAVDRARREKKFVSHDKLKKQLGL